MKGQKEFSEAEKKWPLVIKYFRDRLICLSPEYKLLEKESRLQEILTGKVKVDEKYLKDLKRAFDLVGHLFEPAVIPIETKCVKDLSIEIRKVKDAFTEKISNPDVLINDKPYISEKDKESLKHLEWLDSGLSRKKREHKIYLEINLLFPFEIIQDEISKIIKKMQEEIYSAMPEYKIFDLKRAKNGKRIRSLINEWNRCIEVYELYLKIKKHDEVAKIYYKGGTYNTRPGSARRNISNYIKNAEEYIRSAVSGTFPY